VASAVGGGEAAVVGIDLGTSAVKILAITTAGRQIAEGSEFYGLVTPQPDRVEQDADVVYRATMRVLGAILSDVRMRGSEVRAIGFSSAMHGVVAVDAGGEPLTNAITWLDRRSAGVARRWREDGTGSALYARTGAPMHPMLPVAKLRWLAEHEPELFAKTRRFVGLKELFVFRWTGEWLIDWGIASATGLFDFTTRAWDPAALGAAGIEPGRLSQPMPPSTALRAFRPAIARELGLEHDTAVVLASSDGALANIGVGSGDGDVAVTLGTSGAVRRLSRVPEVDANGRTFCYCADDTRYIIGGPTSAAGASLDWIFALLLDEVPKPDRFARAAELAAQIEPGANGLTVLPFFAGERAPYWNAAMRGAVSGIDLAHDRRTIVRAAFESVVFGVFAVYAIATERTGKAERVLLSGGLTKAPFVRRLLADIFETVAVEPTQPEASAFGAALVAAQAIGAIGDAVATAHSIGYDAGTPPNAALAPAYHDAYDRYRQAVAAELVRAG
jgi:gluconokinase